MFFHRTRTCLIWYLTAGDCSTTFVDQQDFSKNNPSNLNKTAAPKHYFQAGFEICVILRNI